MGARSSSRAVVAPSLVAVVILLAAACTSSSADLEAPNELASVSTVTASPTASPRPTATPVPSPTSVPTPTAIPTPTPTPIPAVDATELAATIEEGFAELDRLGLDYSFALFLDDLGYLTERQADTDLLPASNQKIVTAAGALELLAEDFRFVTELRIDGDNNVYVIGGGDPTITRAHVRRFSDDIEAVLGDGSETAGSPIVINDVVVDPSYFSDTRSGPGWPDRYIPVDVGPMSGFMIDDNQHRGDAVYLANPDLGNAQFVITLLEGSGIDVQGVARVGTPPPSTVVIGERRSPTLAAMVDLILRRSDNEVAEALVRQIGLDDAGESEIDVGKAVLYERIGELGLELGEPVGDGSGLSRQNRLSARDLVEALRLSRAQPWWSVVDNGLADAGARGTLEDRLASEDPIGEVRAKTGTLADVIALSGVFTTVDGVEVTFSFLINGTSAEAAEEILDQIIVAYATATSAQLATDLADNLD